VVTSFANLDIIKHDKSLSLISTLIVDVLAFAY